MAAGIAFDVDGTLLDTNCAHLNAWHRALLHLGFEVSLERIAPELGKGGDNLVPAILGGEVERERGEEIRAEQTREFLEVASRSRFVLFDGARELLEELRRRRVRTCIATSSSPEHFEKMLKQSGVDLPAMVDEVVTREEGMRSKPAPDLVQRAVERLGVPPQRALMIGDTPHDGAASRRAQVAFVGVLCGGNSREALEGADAALVARNPREILDRLGEVLALVP